MSHLFLLFITLLLFPLGAASQETQVVAYSRKYLNLNSSSIEKYLHRVEKQQSRLVKRLRKHEKRLIAQLKDSDTLAYQELKEHPLNYDSISKIRCADGSPAMKRPGSIGSAIDSMEAVRAFLGKYNKTNDSSGPVPDELRRRLGCQEALGRLIDTRQLELAANNSLQGMAAFQRMSKTVYYGKQRIDVLRQMAAEPRKAELAAIEYLQGSMGFSFDGEGPEDAAGEGTQAQDLKAMGLQTREHVNNLLKGQYGTNGRMQRQMKAGISEWTAKGRGLSAGLKKAEGELATARSQITSARESLNTRPRAGSAGFRVNPMRGLPFRKRWRKGYSAQWARAEADGRRPAMLELAGFAEFRHSPRISYGLGIALSTGLGQDWSRIKITYEGLNLRLYASCELIYGIAAYTGYEKLFLSPPPRQATERSTSGAHAASAAIMIGLSKSYKINSKWNGTVQLLYDVWWREKALNSPLVLRFTTNSK